MLPAVAELGSSAAAAAEPASGPLATAVSSWEEAEGAAAGPAWTGPSAMGSGPLLVLGGAKE